jgi:serine/threonine-protein kinase
VPDALGPLQKPLTRAGLPDAADRPDAGELAIALMAAAEDLPRPEPLPLATAAPVIDLPEGDAGEDATMLGGTRVVAPGDTVVSEAVDPAAGAAVALGDPAFRPSPLPEYLDDDLVVHSDDRPGRRWPWVIAATLLAIVLGTGAAFAWNEVRTPSHEVPSLIGKTEAQARATVEELGFDVERRDTRKDGSTPGEVLDTDPKAGEQLKEGDKLVLFVSLGNTPAPVPTDLVGMTLDEAKVALDTAGQFNADPITEVESEEIAAGIVIALGDGVPAELAKGSAVPLTVSKGPKPRPIPTGLEGKTYPEAAAALEAVQLKPKQVDEFSDDVEKGKVIGLRPGEGTAPRDSEVEVVVSKGPDLVAVPSVKSKSLDEAVAAIEGAGLVVGDAFGPANGKPFETNPPSGTKVHRGATIDIYLRR